MGCYLCAQLGLTWMSLSNRGPLPLWVQGGRLGVRRIALLSQRPKRGDSSIGVRSGRTALKFCVGGYDLRSNFPPKEQKRLP